MGDTTAACESTRDGDWDERYIFLTKKTVTKLSHDILGLGRSTVCGIHTVGFIAEGNIFGLKTSLVDYKLTWASEFEKTGKKYSRDKVFFPEYL